jgi:hypothetical protein
MRRKGVTLRKPRKQLTDEKTHRGSSTTITRTRHDGGGETQLEASPESWKALVSRDPATTLHHRRRQNATRTETTQRGDTICVVGVAER